MRIRKYFEQGTARTVFTASVTATLAIMWSVRVSASEMPFLAAGQGVEIASPGTGSHFVSAPQGTPLTGGSEVRIGKAGWAILSLGNKTQVELRADSEAVFPSTSRSEASSGSDPKRGELAATPANAIPAVVEIELRRGTLAALADGETELRVRFANGVAVAHHARLSVMAKQNDPTRVLVERGVARVTASGGAEPVAPTAGQFVEVNKFIAGSTVTAAQPVQGNDADAVAEMAALHFVPTPVDPAAKSPPAVADNSTVTRPVATVTENSLANQPSGIPASVSPTVPPVDYVVAPLGSLVGVDSLQAPANGANTSGPVTSPEHP